MVAYLVGMFKHFKLLNPFIICLRRTGWALTVYFDQMIIEHGDFLNLLRIDFAQINIIEWTKYKIWHLEFSKIYRMYACTCMLAVTSDPSHTGTQYPRLLSSICVLQCVKCTRVQFQHLSAMIWSTFMESGWPSDLFVQACSYGC